MSRDRQTKRDGTEQEGHRQTQTQAENETQREKERQAHLINEGENNERGMTSEGEIPRLAVLPFS